MRIIITGVTSFLGIYTAKQLLSEGHEVYGVVRLGSRNEGKLKNCGLEHLHVLHFDFDDLPENGVENATFDALSSADAWVHFAWDGIGSTGRQDESIQRRNIANAKKAYAMAKALHAAKFLFAGSQAEYGTGNHAMPNPVSAYGKAKLAFGSWAMEESQKAEREHPMQFLHMRIYSVYGAGDHPTSLVNTVMQNAMDDRDTDLGPCTQLWNYLEVRDLSRAISILITSNDTTSAVYDIAGEERRPLRSYVETMHQIAGAGGTLRFGARGNNAEGAVDMAPDNAPLRELGFRPYISFEEGIRDLKNSIINERRMHERNR